MSCKICGRKDCMECFHSIKEQEKFEEEQDLQEETENENKSTRKI